jgi:hypothetical protein
MHAPRRMRPTARQHRLSPCTNPGSQTSHSCASFQAVAGCADSPAPPRSPPSVGHGVAERRHGAPAASSASTAPPAASGKSMSATHSGRISRPAYLSHFRLPVPARGPPIVVKSRSAHGAALHSPVAPATPEWQRDALPAGGLAPAKVSRLEEIPHEETDFRRSPVCSLAGCSTLYYSTMEKFGVAKRDIMVDRVKEAQESQKDAKKEFANALEQFRSVVAVQRRRACRTSTTSSTARCSAARARPPRCGSRIAKPWRMSLTRCSDEWQAELKQFTNPEFRRSSEKQCAMTNPLQVRQADGTAMHKAESRHRARPAAAARAGALSQAQPQRAGHRLADRSELTSVEGQGGFAWWPTWRRRLRRADAFIATMPK